MEASGFEEAYDEFISDKKFKHWTRLDFLRVRGRLEPRVPRALL